MTSKKNNSTKAKNRFSVDIQEALARLSGQPGVYRMYDAEGTLIYVGKAKSLKNRVRSYFQESAQHSPKVLSMVQQIVRFDTVITDSEVEALALECNLIKAHRPKYNILMKDDKRYPWLALSDEPFPRLYITRKTEKRGKTRFFGPYLNSTHLYETLQVLRRHFPLRQRRKPLFKNRPCMNYYIGACLGPCQDLVTEADYQVLVDQVSLFLKGKTSDLLKQIEAEMLEASESLNFERAAKLRDRHEAVLGVMQQQHKVVSADETVHQDLIAYGIDEQRLAVVILQIRYGKVIGTYAQQGTLSDLEEIDSAVQQSIKEYYYQLPDEELPDSIVSTSHFEDVPVLLSWLNQRRSSQNSSSKRRDQKRISKKEIVWLSPKSKDQRELLALGQKNVAELLEQTRLEAAQKLQRDPTRALLELQEALRLPEYLTRIECYDISHFQGQETVASMVVFTDGVSDKAAYRRFKIHSAEGKPDDFKSMAEVIARRIQHPDWGMPDLMIIDGGKGQLSAAKKSLEQAGIWDQPIVSLAKQFEEVFLPGESRPVLLSRSSNALFLMQQIRDEAHRFAITYHRQRRGKAAQVSVLDDIKGLGPKGKEKLGKALGSVDNIISATPVDWAKSLGISVERANVLYQQVKEKSGPSF
ncbi:MAG: excinuclease ABC subunit UvrC [Cyanobacteria bacterium]|nr:excinuclease ABC subunit UvrC [Cyanobacteriota bacterium]